MLPTAILLDSENDGNEHRIMVMINNKVIYETSLHAVDNISTFYDLNTLVSDYMSSHRMPICTLSLIALFDSHQESASTTVIYSSQLLDSEDISSFLTNHYLTTRRSFVIPKNCEQNVHLFVPQGITSVKGKLDILYSFQGKQERIIVDFPISPGADSLAHFSVSSELINSAIQAIRPIEDIRILSARVSHGRRNLLFFFTKEQPLCTFEFLNLFCLPELYHVFGSRKITTEFSQEEGSLSGITHFYNRTSQQNVQIESAPLQQEEALWLNQFLGSPQVYLKESSGKSREVLIKDITSEISNQPNEQVTLKFSWAYNTNTSVLKDFSSPSVFNNSFNDSFS